MLSVDLNCDLGEDLPEVDESVLMPHLSSCSIACGGHAGDLESMAATVRLALRHDVAIGAHPSYPDRDGFGRRSINLTAKELRETIQGQCLDLARVVTSQGTRLRHVKPHGALYNDMVLDPARAEVVLSAVLDLDLNLRVYGMADSALADLAASVGVPFVHEVFADRAYEAPTRLLARTESNALLTEPDPAVAQVRGFVERSEVQAGSRSRPVTADSICVHSDTPNADSILSAVHAYLRQRNVDVRPPR